MLPGPPHGEDGRHQPGQVEFGPERQTQTCQVRRKAKHARTWSRVQGSSIVFYMQTLVRRVAMPRVRHIDEFGKGRGALWCVHLDSW